MPLSLKNFSLCPDAKTPTLFLPGWGFDGRILQLLAPAPKWLYPLTPLDPATIDQDLLHLLDSRHMEKVRLIGWSMGAMLGLDFAARHGSRIASLVLVALRSHWPSREIRDIRHEFNRSPEIFLKDFYRKCFLGDKQAYRNFTSTLEALYLAALEPNREILLRGLEYLENFKIPRPLPDVPVRLIHGRQDLVAPVKDIPFLPEAATEIIDNGGHGVFLHEKCSLRRELKKEAIRAQFSQAAHSYDSYAKVQVEAARRLAALLPPADRKTARILEIGCGTGNFSAMLAERYPGAEITALDFSPAMIEKAREKIPDSRISFTCADAELFLATTPAGSFDLVASNGSLQWFSDTEKVFADIARILVPGGSLFCSIFGPDSLQELNEGLQALTLRKEVLAARSFQDGGRLAAALRQSFPDGSITEARIEKKYRSAHDLLRHIKKTGTSGWSQGTGEQLTPDRIRRLDAWFQATYGTCRITYQLFFLQGSKSNAP